MVEVTEQDRENYKKLQELVETLRTGITGNLMDKLPNKDLLRSLFDKLLPITTAPPKELDTIQALESRLDQIDAYLGPQNLLLTSPPPEIDKATQELLEQSNLIKESLQDIKDADLSTLDDFGSPCSDARFFELIPGKNTDPLKTWTKRLLAGHSLDLPSADISADITKLTDAWGIAVSEIIKDAQNQALQIKPGTPDTIFRFFCIHEELEDLYDKVSNLVA